MKTGRYFYAVPEHERSLSWTMVFTCVAALALCFLVVVLTRPIPNTTEPKLPEFKVEPTTTLTGRP